VPPQNSGSYVSLSTGRPEYEQPDPLDSRAPIPILTDHLD
jgi:hypothetical protein